MIIYEYAKCDICAKRYKGKFSILRDGTVSCVNCDKPIKYNGMEREEVGLKEERLLKEIVKDFLIKDMNRIYEPKAEKENLNLDFLRKDNGDLDERKIYFQGNPVELVIKAHKKAYKCLEYLESGVDKGKYRDFAEGVVQDYLDLRERKLEEDEIENLIGRLTGMVMMDIEKELMLI